MANTVDQNLLESAAKGDLTGVENALKAGAHINATTEYNDTALNSASLFGHIDVVRRLLEESPDLENKGGAQLTPLMNAATRGHVAIVQILIERGARVSDDLLSTIQHKINILEENAEAGMVTDDGVRAWKDFQESLITERYRQDVPELVRLLSENGERQHLVVADLREASRRGVDITAAVPVLSNLTSEDAAAALTAQLAAQGEWDKLAGLIRRGEPANRSAAVDSLNSASARGHIDAPLLPAVIELLDDSDPEIRRSGALILASAAGRKLDISNAYPRLVELLSESDERGRRGAVICFYRLAAAGANIEAALPALKELANGKNPTLRALAEKVLNASS